MIKEKKCITDEKVSSLYVLSKWGSVMNRILLGDGLSSDDAMLSSLCFSMCTCQSPQTQTAPKSGPGKGGFMKGWLPTCAQGVQRCTATHAVPAQLFSALDPRCMVKELGGSGSSVQNFESESCEQGASLGGQDSGDKVASYGGSGESQNPPWPSLSPTSYGGPQRPWPGSLFRSESRLGARLKGQREGNKNGTAHQRGGGG